MNRYTFKAKRKDNGEWVYGYYLEMDNKSLIVTEKETKYVNYYNGYLYYLEQVEIDGNTLCQCTGLQDVDGKDIFENDKIRGLRHHNKKQVIIEGFIEYNEFLARYDVTGNYYNGNQLSAFTNVEIIGNKFDKEVE